ncbi:MAG: hypothetical protein WKF80_11220 [Thermomicrobiales bacterium]
MTLDPITHDYLALAHGIDRLVPGFIDAYTGPPREADRLGDAEPATPLGLLEQARALAEQVMTADYPERRRGYLAAQAGAMVEVCRSLAGEAIDYGAEVRGRFDIEATHTPEAEFDAAIAAIDDALPGTGPIPARMAAWRDGFTVSPDVAMGLLDVIVPEIRRRTLAFVDLPVGEDVQFALVNGQPWSGYNWFLGETRSRVELNTDLPIRANGLTGLVCHEAYPGHHTEHGLKEWHLYRQRGWDEHAVQLISTPQAVISEGIATLAETVVFPGGELYAWQAETLYPRAGITGDPAREARLDAAGRALRAVNANAALLLHGEGAGEDEAVAYIMRYGLRDEAEARQSLRFIADPTWRSYVFTYHAGRDLLGRWLDRDDPDQATRLDRFRELLTTQVTPSLVAGWLAAGPGGNDGSGPGAGGEPDETAPDPAAEAIPSPS